MTTEKREPFAKVFEYGINIGGVECFSEGNDWEVARAINRAFNARVDAEVRQAVGEFRTRAVLVAIDHPKYCHGLNVWDCCGTIVDGLRSLPTEPERKGKGE